MKERKCRNRMLWLPRNHGVADTNLSITLLTPRHIALRFSLIYSRTSSIVTYSPKIDSEKDVELLKCLPSYLTVDIEFEKEYEDKFFWRILNFNHEESQ